MENFTINILNKDGTIVNNILLSLSKKERSNSIHLSVAYRCQLSAERVLKKNFYENKKSRGEVSGGGKKPYKQKGTGRARQGSIRAPQWKGGGVVFGPNGDQRRSLLINKKSKKKALKEIIVQRLITKKIMVIEEITLEDYKTKNSVTFLSNIYKNNWHYNRSLVIVISIQEINKELLIRSFRNLKNVEIVTSSFLNLVKFVSSNYFFFTRKAFEEILNRAEVNYSLKSNE